MSGSVSQSAVYPQPVTLSTEPKEGSKAVTISVYWLNYLLNNPSDTLEINLLSQFQSGQFTTVQAVQIDNSTNPYPIQVTSLETAASFLVPGFAQGMYPLLCGPAPVLSIAMLNGSSATLNGTTRFTFLNTPHAFSESRMPTYGYGVAITQGRGAAIAPGSDVTVINFHPTAPGGHWTIAQIDLTLLSSVAIPGGVTCTVELVEQNPGFIDVGVLWSDIAFPATSSADGLLYVRSATLATPIICQKATSNVVARVTTAMTSAVYLSWQIQYGFVVIQ